MQVLYSFGQLILHFIIEYQLFVFILQNYKRVSNGADLAWNYTWNRGHPVVT